MQLQTEGVPCNLCGASSYQKVSSETYELNGSRVSLGVVRCNHCKLVYTNPRLTQDSTFLVYEHDTAHTISSNYCWAGDHSQARFVPLIRRLHKLSPTGKLLDVGCGSGDFLRAASQSGNWDSVGVEPIENAAESARSVSDAEVHTSVLEKAPISPNSMDIVTMLGVLEHLHDPADTLSTVRQLLKPSGLLAIYVPNFNYLRVKDTGPLCFLRRRRWSDLHPQEHQFHFTVNTLHALLQKGGFEVLRTDVGQPFAVGNAVVRNLKRGFHVGVQALWRQTGVHLGGLEVIARVSDCVASPSYRTPAA
ncbi:MAG: class I SAM-dependent methyltransferase [Planctomycetes bacterium]|nr:class I SAM-dependent methyltransferase [Planctomycetota bacterium]